uniref:Reverse transcriptase RNase H-like domain-containing protein n=1 Tax=Fagus sylvatica TaxID=28930 RepID=A0A2N9EWP2_FAGSY
MEEILVMKKGPTRSTADVGAAKLEEELKEMKEQMKEMKSQVKAKAVRNLDMLVHRSESPFTKNIDEPNEFVAFTVFNVGLRKGDFLFQFCKDPPKSMLELMYGAQKFINVEDTFEARDEFPSKNRKEPKDRRFESSKNRVSKPDYLKVNRKNVGSSSGQGGQPRSFTPLNMSVDQVFLQIQDDPALKWPGKLHSSPGRRASQSSRKAYALQAHNILDTQRPRKNVKLDNQVITYSKDDARGIHQPHDDALIVTMTIVMTSVKFLVVDCPSAYNVIIGRPTLNKLRAVTSTYHLLVCFPTEHGIGKLKRDQAAARECYFASLGLETKHQTMAIGEGQKLVEPTEKLKHAWYRPLGHLHKLNVDSSMRPIKQKRRVFAPDRNQAISNEVEKLLTVGFIREVYYFDWLANVVMVKNSNGKWSICVDFTDLNKACLKDSFPLPRIDQLVDSTAGHKLMTFMDAFSGATYQRLMNKMFHNQIGLNVEVYIYDMLVKTKDEDKHLDNLEETFKTLRQYRMKLNPISPTAVSSTLIREENGLQLPVYYTSKAFQGAEERYPAMEKLALALVIATRKLRLYFQVHTIIVLTNHPLCKAMSKPDVVGRLIQWTIELSEFDIEYRPRQAIKAQALADFITEFTTASEEPPLDKGEPKEKWEVNIDGSSVKGVGGVKIAFKTPKGRLLKHVVRLQYPTTNNEAKYEALLHRPTHSQGVGSDHTEGAKRLATGSGTGQRRI